MLSCKAIAIKPSGKDFPTRVFIPVLGGALILALLNLRPTPAAPQFVRRYNLDYQACHMMPPTLNENWYPFKWPGYHLPPAPERDKPAQQFSRLLKQEPAWQFSNNAAPSFGWVIELVRSCPGIWVLWTLISDEQKCEVINKNPESWHLFGLPLVKGGEVGVK